MSCHSRLHHRDRIADLPFRVTKFFGIAATGPMVAMFAVLTLGSIAGCTRDESVDRPAIPSDRATASLGEGQSSVVSVKDRVREVLLAVGDDRERMVSEAVRIGRAGETRVAAEMLRLSVAEHLSDTTESQVQLAVRSLLEVGRLSDAAALAEEVLEVHADFHTLRRTLCGLWGELDRPDRALVHFETLVRQRRFDLGLLIAHLTEGQRLYAQRTIDTMLQRHPQDKTVLLGRAREAYQHADQVTAKRTLDEILGQHPQFGPALAMRAMIVAELDPETFDPKWFESHRGSVGEHPEYWLAMAEVAEASGDLAAATDAASHAVAKNPRDAKSWSTLLSLVQQADRAADAATVDRISRTTQGLLELKKRFFQFNGESRTRQTAAVPIIEGLLQLGRNWEAEAWAAVATTLPNHPSERIERLRQQAIVRMRSQNTWSEVAEFARELPSTLAVAGSAERWRAVAATSSVSLDSFATRSDPSGSDRDIDPADDARFELRDEAVRRGVEFYGRIGATVAGPHVLLSETVGCGGGAIDFDSDGWPDVVLMAAGGTFGGRDSDPNALFRNLNGTFELVTNHAGCVDRHFGQGVLVSDFDEDGFDDVLFLAAGPNTLWINQGDGTFVERSDRLFGASDAWSTSAARMDINGDGWADIYVANYCEMTPSLSEPCVNGAGQTITCHPLQFAAGRDQAFWGDPNGNYVAADPEEFQWASAGRGLGVVAGPMIGTRSGLFVANDMSANHFFEARADNKLAGYSDASVSFSDSAVLRGVAVDARSLTQASMGIAADDLDGDGDMDLHVTGFAREFNLFYEQTSAGLFVDKTRRRGLEPSTVDKVGFGCQALDIDGDGHRELVVANGHIGDFGKEIPYAQNFQIFTPGPSGRYRLLSASNFSAYFRKPHVGRAVWKSDVDRDGRSDVWVTHATEPVALLMNRSPSKGRPTTVRLVGVHSGRRPVSATATVSIGGKALPSDEKRLSRPPSQTGFVVSGDGYLCSNQNALTFEVQSEGGRGRLTVDWPTGRRQTFSAIELGRDYLVIEGNSEAFRLDGSDVTR